MKGFGVHTSLWSINWTREGAERAISEASKYPLDFIEIALLDPPAVDAPHTAKLLDEAELSAVCSLGLPDDVWASKNPEGAVEFLKVALDKTAECGAQALSGVTYGGIGERTGNPPTDTERDNIARALTEAAAYAKTKGLLLGIEPINRYENHILNTGWQAA
ncbi:MAG: TIM barrel protein, partial [Pseudomonadota bacterium]